MGKKRVVITGGSGLLALNWACALRENWSVILGVHNHPVRLAGTSTFKLDLDDREELNRQLESLAPDLIVHTAGLTSVDRCEELPNLAYQVNVELAKNVAIVSAQMDTRLIHISTDHLFSGEHRFYSEDEVVTPLNEYARSKALAELCVVEANPESLIIRTNFFGWGHVHRQSFSDWLLFGLRAGKSLPLFQDVYYTPILADNVALIAHKLSQANVKGIFNVVGDERLSKYEFGLSLAEMFSLPKNLLKPVSVAQAHFAAARPMDMSLDNTKVKNIVGEPIGSVLEFLHSLRVQEQSGRSQELIRALNILK